MVDLIEKLKKMNTAKFRAYIKNHQNEIQTADPETIEYVLAKWGDDKPFPYPVPDAMPVHPPEDEVKAAADEIAREVREMMPNLSDTPPTAAPRPEAPSAPNVTLTRQERHLAELIAASTDIPDVIEVNDMAGFRDPLAVPEGLRRPEFSYRWVSNENLQRSLTLFGGLWTPVNRTNHPQADSQMFDATGGLRFSGQVVLCFCRRETMGNRQKKIIRDFNFKADKAVQDLERDYTDPSGKVVAHTEITGERADGDYGHQPLTTDADYDFGNPL